MTAQIVQPQEQRPAGGNAPNRQRTGASTGRLAVDSETPLITAASYGELEIARVLIDAGADLEATGQAGLGGTALGHAINFGMTDIVDLLVAAGARIRGIVDAAGAGDLDGLLTLPRRAPRTRLGLQTAAICERLDVIDALLAAGTPVDAEVEGATAVHATAMNGKARSVTHLLARGADPNRLDANYHSTPLGWCWHRRTGWGPADGCAEVERLLEPVTAGDWVPDEVRVHHDERDDAPAIAAVLATAFAQHRGQYTSAAYAATVPDVGAIAARFGEGPVWVAVRAGEVIGTISAVPDGATLHLRSLAVVPAARGAGVGDQLINRATEWAFPTGFDRLTLDTTPFLLAAQRLYARHGFVVGDRPAHDLHGTPLVTMTQDLAAIREAANAGTN